LVTPYFWYPGKQVPQYWELGSLPPRLGTVMAKIDVLTRYGNCTDGNIPSAKSRKISNYTQQLGIIYNM
jgi:hypothetical protein